MKTLTKIEQFQLFCIESYRQTSDDTSLAVLNEFTKLGVFDYLAEGFEVLHTQGKNYIISDIREYIAQHRGKSVLGDAK
jgi:hypothetical protein